MGKFPDGLCQICGGDTYGGFVREPFIFGKKPGEICFGCYNIPKDFFGWQPGEPRNISTEQEMIEGGWDKKEAKRLIKAFKKYFKIRK